MSAKRKCGMQPYGKETAGISSPWYLITMDVAVYTMLSLHGVRGAPPPLEWRSPQAQLVATARQFARNLMVTPNEAVSGIANRVNDVRRINFR